MDSSPRPQPRPYSSQNNSRPSLSAHSHSSLPPPPSAASQSAHYRVVSNTNFITGTGTDFDYDLDYSGESQLQDHIQSRESHQELRGHQEQVLQRGFDYPLDTSCQQEQFDYHFSEPMQVQQEQFDYQIQQLQHQTSLMNMSSAPKSPRVYPTSYTIGEFH